MKTLFILLILVLGMSVNAQVLMFKALEGEATETGVWTNELVEVTKNVIIVYDMDNDKISTVAEVITDFYIVNQEGSPEREDKYDPVFITFQCVDSNGVKPTLRVSWFEDKTVGFSGKYDYRWTIYYGNVWYAYECNKLK